MLDFKPLPGAIVDLFRMRRSGTDPQLAVVRTGSARLLRVRVKRHRRGEFQYRYLGQMVLVGERVASVYVHNRRPNRLLGVVAVSKAKVRASKKSSHSGARKAKRRPRHHKPSSQMELTLLR